MLPPSTTTHQATSKHTQMHTYINNVYFTVCVGAVSSISGCLLVTVHRTVHNEILNSAVDATIATDPSPLLRTYLGRISHGDARQRVLGVNVPAHYRTVRSVCTRASKTNNT